MNRVLEITQNGDLTAAVKGLWQELGERDGGFTAAEVGELFARIFGAHADAAGVAGEKCWLDGVDWFIDGALEDLTPAQVTGLSSQSAEAASSVGRVRGRAPRRAPKRRARACAQH